MHFHSATVLLVVVSVALFLIVVIVLAAILAYMKLWKVVREVQENPYYFPPEEAMYEVVVKDDSER